MNQGILKEILNFSEDLTESKLVEIVLKVLHLKGCVVEYVVNLIKQKDVGLVGRVDVFRRYFLWGQFFGNTEQLD
jgi:hypothetical protein